MSRESNIVVFEDTLKHCYGNEDLKKAIDYSTANQQIVCESLESTPRKFDDRAVVKVTRNRTFEAAESYKNKRVAVLNFASHTNPGGGVKKGSNAQEESLCRCSTLYPILRAAEDDFHRKHRKMIRLDMLDSLYNDDCIYTPDVVVFKTDTRRPRLLDESEWYMTDVITCAAPNLRRDPSNKINPHSGKRAANISDEELFNLHRQRIAQIFQLAKNSGAEVLVLGAFGCGAFKNPPEIVARAFREVTEEFIYDFKVIEFAIYGSRRHENYDVFREALGDLSDSGSDMKEILKDFKSGKISLEECEKHIKADNVLEFNEIARFDSSRSLRTGFPEAVYAESKSYDDLLLIIKNYFENSRENLIVTRLSDERFKLLAEDLKYLMDEGVVFDYNRPAEILVLRTKPKTSNPIAKVGIITAGTSDINVAEEAKVIVEEGGCEAITSYDVGVAGIHRLFPEIANMIKEDVKVIIACAGMEGALPTVVAGLVDIPIVAVPTSVGYGVGEGGFVALNSMLQSCAPGIAVVNIDNGFGAAIYALTIIKSFL